MEVLDVFVVAIDIVPTIFDNPLHNIHLNVNALYWTLLLTLSFIKIERKRLQERLALVVSVAMKRSGCFGHQHCGGPPH